MIYQWLIKILYQESSTSQELIIVTVLWGHNLEYLGQWRRDSKKIIPSFMFDLKLGLLPVL